MKSKTEMLRVLLSLLPQRARLVVEFFIKTGYWPNLRCPKTFNEKIQLRKIEWNNPFFTTACDKYLVRLYVEKKIGVEYLIDLLYCGKNICMQDLRKILKERRSAVVKINNDSGSVFFISQNMSDAELKVICDKVNKKMNNRFGNKTFEEWYSNVDPLIIVEEDISEPGSTLNDYKLHVFNGPKGRDIVFHVDYGRRTAGRGRTFYSSSYEVLPIKQKVFSNSRKPFPLEHSVADKLQSLAYSLAEGINYVRVDFYYVKGRIYFGELTFAPGSGFTGFDNKEQDLFLGAKWDFVRGS